MKQSFLFYTLAFTSNEERKRITNYIIIIQGLLLETFILEKYVYVRKFLFFS